MHASHKSSLQQLLSSLVMVAVLIAPCAFAKKDLFATEPGTKNGSATQQLAPNDTTKSEDPNTGIKIQNEAIKPNDNPVTPIQTFNIDTKKNSLEPSKEPATKEPLAQKEMPTRKELSAPKDATESKESPISKEPSAIEIQFERLKRNLTRTKNDLFGSKDTSEKKTTETSALEAQPIESTAEENIKPTVVTISTTEAAQRAQMLADGQVINVRLYQENNQEEDKPRYAVKLLQKNGRMKTITLDAINGALIEEIP